jgi:hypothetical protein
VTSGPHKADSTKLPPYETLDWQTMPKQQHMGLKIKLWAGWLHKLWGRLVRGRPRILLRKWGMLVLDVFKGSLTLDAKSVILCGHTWGEIIS